MHDKQNILSKFVDSEAQVNKKQPCYDNHA